ncbi:MAG: hypothetical protein V4689_01055 [Verrucomicrobiota bacterium]
MFSFERFPEVKKFLNEELPIILSESDRGALLLCASYIDDALTSFFDALKPVDLSNKKKKELNNGFGPFGSFASKLDIALGCRLLPENLIEAIHQIRKARNSAAHKAQNFPLEDTWKYIRKCFEQLGDGFKESLAILADERSLYPFIVKALSLVDPDCPDNPIFGSEAEARESLKDIPAIKQQIEELRFRQQLGIATGAIYGFLLIYQVEYTRGLGSRSIIDFIKTAPTSHHTTG